MAGSKRSTKTTRKPAAKRPASRSTSTKKRGDHQTLVRTATLVWEWLSGSISREVVGLVLFAMGLFFTAAFLTGRGSFLGDAGLVAATHLFGLVGASIPPVLALGGLLMMLGYVTGRNAAGAGLLVCGVAASFALALSPQQRFDPQRYTEAGGVIGSGIQVSVDWIGGTVGVILVLCMLYVVGFSLLTGIGPRAAVDLAKNAFRGAVAWMRTDTTESTSPARKKKTAPSSRNAKNRQPVSASAPTEKFEVILPEKREEEGGLARIQERVNGEYTPPPVSLLKTGSGTPEHDAEEVSRRLTAALADLGVQAQVSRAVVGPRVTRYELRLGSGVKVGKVRNLQQDIAYALAATEVRILAPIPGKSAVGVEVPNPRPATVTLGDVFREYPGANEWALPVGLGKDLSGRAVFFNLAEMPHLLVAGTTGSGKSVMLNSILISLLLTTDPRQVKLVLVDPKRVELSQFGRIPHLITPVVTDVKRAANALSWAVAEMERRYEVLEKHGVRSLEGYNDRSEQQMPYVVVVIDELADLMMAAAAKVEDAVIRLAQKARAVGIHLVVATQRPSVDVITGMIKANIPSRIAFAVSSQVDSRVILDGPGAEALLGKGDMLFKPVYAMRPSRIQGAFISDSEVGKVVAASEGKVEPHFVEEVIEAKEHREEEREQEDELLPEAARFVVSTQQASVSAVQRRFRVGYSRAGRIIDALERKGVVGPYEGSKSRSVVATEFDLAGIFGAEDSNLEENGDLREDRDGDW